MIPEPVLNCQRTLPVRASAALNQPSSVPKKTRSPAVATVPLQVGYLSGIVQTFLPLIGSQAIYLVPLMVGTRNIAFPRLNAYSYYLYLFGGIMFYVAFLCNT